MRGRSLGPASRWNAALLLALATAACKNGTDPEDRPAISSITPAQALAGAQVTVMGDNFGNDPGEVSVRFGGAEAPVVSSTNRRLETAVPALAPGAVDVVVRVGDDESNPLAFTVLRPAPTIAAVTPQPVRAGGVLTITGSELAGAAVRVLAADSIPLPIVSVTDSRIDATVPFNLPTGRYGLRVETDGQLSDRVFQDVEIFDVSGAYSVGGMVVLNSCSEGPPVGSVVTRTAAVTDGRPTLTMNLGPAGQLLQGVLEASGSFDTSIVGGETTFSGRFFALDGDTAALSGRIEIRPDGSRCRILEEVTGERS